MRAQFQTPRTPQQKIQDDGRVVDLRGMEMGVRAETPGVGLGSRDLVGGKRYGGGGGEREDI